MQHKSSPSQQFRMTINGTGVPPADYTPDATRDGTV